MATVTSLGGSRNFYDGTARAAEVTVSANRDDVLVALFSTVSGVFATIQGTAPTTLTTLGSLSPVGGGGPTTLRFAVYVGTCQESFTNKTYVFYTESGYQTTRVWMWKITPATGHLVVPEKTVWYSTYPNILQGASSVSVSTDTDITNKSILIGSKITDGQNSIDADNDTFNGSWSTQQTIYAAHPSGIDQLDTQYKICTGSGQQSYGGSVRQDTPVALSLSTFTEISSAYWGVRA
jgi:hypothetical protein